MVAALTIDPEMTAPNKPADGRFTVAEYFAGIGLFRMGLEVAGW